MDDRTRTHGHAGGEYREATPLTPALSRQGRGSETPSKSDPGAAGLILGAMLAVILGALIVAGLATAIGTWPAVIVSTLAFAGLVWVLVPTSEAPNLHAERILDGPALAGKPPVAPENTEKNRVPGARASGSCSRFIRRGLAVACLGGVCGIVMSVVPGCAESPAHVAAFEALDTNRQQLDPMTLRGIADAESTGDVSPALGEQYRGLLSDQNALIDALLGREPEAVVEVDPEE